MEAPSKLYYLLNFTSRKTSHLQEIDRINPPSFSSSQP